LALVLSLSGNVEAQTQFRINVGEGDFTDTNGDLFVADKAFVAGDFGSIGGVTQTFSGTGVSGTTDDLLYQSMRGGSSFSYIFDNIVNGDYDITLYFMESFFTSAGERQFDVSVEGVVVLEFRSSGGLGWVLCSSHRDPHGYGVGWPIEHRF
jgi:hypothetical protein